MGDMPEAEIEHLVSIILADGAKIVFSRTANKEVRVCKEGHCVVLPKASGQLTLDFLALLDGQLEEEPLPPEKVTQPPDDLST